MTYGKSSSEVVEVCGKTFVVHKANTVMGAMRSVLIQRYNEPWSEIEVKTDDIEMMSLRFIETFQYPTFIAVTTCDEELPTLKEFKLMPEEEVKKWEEAVMRQNPTYFDFGTDEEKKS